MFLCPAEDQCQRGVNLMGGGCEPQVTLDAWLLCLVHLGKHEVEIFPIVQGF